ncbi:MAG: PQQ-binding-like beta-propeller repeat protein [Thermoplasmata archaeon]
MLRFLPQDGLRTASWAAPLVIALAVVLLLSSPALTSGQAPQATGPPTPTRVDAAVALPPGGNFSTYLGNVERTSSSHSEKLINLTTAGSLHLLWSYDTGKEPVQSQPVEQDGIVYFGANTGYEYALYAINGTLLWKTFLGLANTDSACNRTEGVTSTATVEGSHLYVDGGSPYFYTLNSNTGAVEWQTPVGSGTNAEGFYDWSSPLVSAQRAYVGIASQCDQPLVQAGVDEFSLTTHDLVKSFDTSAPAPNGSSVWGSPSLNAETNTLFVATGDPYGASLTEYSESILALNATTLAVKAKWQVPVLQTVPDGDFGVTPTLFTPSGGYPMVTAANKNGILYALYQSNLTLAWEAPLCCTDVEDEHISTAWGGGYVYAVSSDTTVGGVSYNSSVRAFNPRTGVVVWAKGFSDSSYDGYAAPLWVNGLLIVPDEHTLLVLNAKTGATIYQYNQPGHFQAAASISRGEVFVGSSDGRVYAFGPTSLPNRAGAHAPGVASGLPGAPGTRVQSTSGWRKNARGRSVEL